MVKIAIYLLIIMVTLGGSILGDVNFDYRVNVLDMTIVSRIIQNRYTPTQAQRKAADMNCDGIVSSADLTAIADHMMGRS